MAFYDQYLDLADGERVVYRTKIHPVSFLPAAIFIALSVVGFLTRFKDIAEVSLGCAVALAVNIFFVRLLSDFVVTNRRVLGKYGRNYPEVTLMELRSVEFRPGLLGRMFNYGTVLITDRQGGKQKFQIVPVEFYKQIEARLARIQRILK